MDESFVQLAPAMATGVYHCLKGQSPPTKMFDRYASPSDPTTVIINYRVLLTASVFQA
jgi:hypothetical protein